MNTEINKLTFKIQSYDPYTFKPHESIFVIEQIDYENNNVMLKTKEDPSSVINMPIEKFNQFINGYAKAGGTMLTINI
jgi:hypothetical protein